MASSGVVLSSAPSRSSGRGTRLAAAFGAIGLFLALEPLVRGLLWWQAPESFSRGYLHSDTNWLILAVIGLLGVSTFAEARALALRRMWLVRLALLWAVMAAFSSAFALEPGLAADRSLWWVLGLLFALALLVALRRQPEGAMPILLGWCLGFCAYASVLLAFILIDPIREHTDWVGGLPGVANVRHLGFEAMTAALIGSLFRPAGVGRLTIWGLRIAAIVGWAVLFWSGGRGSFLAACATLGVILLLSSSGSRQRLIEWALLMVAGFLIATLHTPAGGSFGAWRTIGLTTAEVAAREIDANQVTSGRWAIWRESAQLIIENPLLGIGEAHTPLRVESARAYAQPHNIFLQAGLAWGLLGGAAFLCAIGYGVWQAAKRVRGASTSVPAVVGFGVLFALTANSLLDGTLFHPRPVAWFLIGMCLALAGATESPSRPHSPKSA